MRSLPHDVKYKTRRIPRELITFGAGGGVGGEMDSDQRYAGEEYEYVLRTTERWLERVRRRD
jgi:hypothetical protein